MRAQTRKTNMRATTAKAGCVLTPTGSYTDQTTCQAQGQCNWKYGCTAEGLCALKADGVYNTLDDCFGSAGKCGWKWKCSNGTCVQDPAGTFATQAECQSSSDPTLGRCGWKWGCASVTQAEATADPTGKNYEYQGALFQVTDANKASLKATPQELKCIAASTTSGGPSCVCKYDPALTPAYTTMTACASDSIQRCGWKWGCAKVTQADETADPTGKNYNYQGALTQVTSANSASLKATPQELKCVAPSIATGGPTCVCQYDPAITPSYTTVADCQANPGSRCGWKWDCATITPGAYATDPNGTNYQSQAKLVLPTSTNSATIKNTLGELTCVSPSGEAGPSCTCQFNTGVAGKYSNVDACIANTGDMCSWQYGTAEVTVIPNAKAVATDAAVWYVDMKAKTRRQYPDGNVFKSWWPSGTTVVVPEIATFATGATMTTRTATDPYVADVNYERQSRLINSSTSNAQQGYKTYAGRTWVGGDGTGASNGPSVVLSSAFPAGGTLDQCITSIMATTGASGGYYDGTNKTCQAFSGVGALQYALGTATAIVKNSTISNGAYALGGVSPSTATVGPSCVCGAPTSTSPSKYFDTITKCKADTTSQCGWMYNCTAGDPITISSGGSTLKFDDSKYTKFSFNNPGDVYVPIGSPFVAYKPFIQVVSSGTGSAKLPTLRYTGAASTTTTPVSDFAEMQFAVVAYGNSSATGDSVDPVTTNPVVVAGLNVVVGKSDTATTIPALTATTGGLGAVKVGHQYGLFLKVRDMTDDDLVVTWPSFTVTQLDALPNSTMYLAGMSAATAKDGSFLLRKDTNPSNPDTLYKGDNVGGATWETNNVYGSKELLVPVSYPFKAGKPYLAVRSDDSGGIYASLTNYDDAPNGTGVTSGNDDAAARFVLLGYGNVVPGKLDNTGTETAPIFNAILWGNESVYAGRDQTQTIPGFTSTGIQTGNAIAEAGKTYRMYMRIWDRTDDMIRIKWPTFSVTFMDAAAAGVVNTTVSNVAYPNAITSGDNSPCLLFDTAYTYVSAYNGTMYSPDGTKQLYMNNGTLTVKNLSNNTTRTTQFPANAANTHLCMQTDGNLVMYPEQGGSALAESKTYGAAGAPFTLSLSNDGIIFVKNTSGGLVWRDPAVRLSFGYGEVDDNQPSLSTVTASGGPVIPDNGGVSRIPFGSSDYRTAFLTSKGFNPVNCDNGGCEYGINTSSAANVKNFLFPILIFRASANKVKLKTDTVQFRIGDGSNTDDAAVWVRLAEFGNGADKTYFDAPTSATPVSWNCGSPTAGYNNSGVVYTWTPKLKVLATAGTSEPGYTTAGSTRNCSDHNMTLTTAQFNDTIVNVEMGKQYALVIDMSALVDNRIKVNWNGGYVEMVD